MTWGGNISMLTFINARKSALLCGAMLSAVTVHAPLAAQETALAEDEGVIIVTAQKRAQSTLDVGINIAVVDSEAITAQRIDDVTDIIALAPNIAIKEKIGRAHV